MTQRRRARPPSDAGTSRQTGGRQRRVRPEIDDATGGGGRRRRRVRPTAEDDGRRGAADEPAPPAPRAAQAPTEDDVRPAASADEGRPSTATAADQDPPSTATAADADVTPASGGEGADAAGDDGEEAPAPPSWWAHPVLRAGAYAWALIGLLVLAVAVGMAAGALRLVVVPLLLALFPAALLYPVCQRLRGWGLPPALASLATMLAVLALLAGVGTALAPQVASEIPEILDSSQQGVREVESFLNTTAPFGIDAAELRAQFDEAVEQIDTQAVMDVVRAGALGAAAAVAEIAVMILLFFVVLFFYLKDGERLGRWVCGLFPSSARADAEAVGLQAWTTIGAYFRGQILVAVVDAIGIGIGLWILGVPLALPLAVLVFFGALFPIVGAVVSGAVAVLVALATNGAIVALVVLGILVAIQQLEGNVVAPYVLGRATALHPLAVLMAITAGSILLSVLGAFLAVPVAASITRGVGTLRQRQRQRRADSSTAATAATG